MALWKGHPRETSREEKGSRWLQWSWAAEGSPNYTRPKQKLATSLRSRRLKLTTGVVATKGGRRGTEYEVSSSVVARRPQTVFQFAELKTKTKPKTKREHISLDLPG